MRKLNRIILHCTATPEGKHFDVKAIRGWHLQRGWRDIGYHYVIYLDGSVHEGRPIEQVGAHTSGQNADSIGIAYVGGVNAAGRAKDTLNEAQETALVNLIKHLREQYGQLTLHGHNEYAAKACPSFNVKTKFPWLLAVLLLASCSPKVTETITIRETQTVHDTITLRDSVTLVNDRVQVEVVRLPGDRIYVKGTCKGDTVRMYEKTIKEVAKSDRKTEKAAMLVISILGLALLAVILKK